LEQGGRQSLLAEALTTQATALARLGHHEQASLAFHRAIEVAYQSGALNDAGLAALALLEELYAAFRFIFKDRNWIKSSLEVRSCLKSPARDG
jgi:hypothetical protein